MIRMIQADPCAPVRNAYDNVTGNAPAEVAEAVSTFAFVETLLRRRRGECFPPVPRSLADVDIQGEWALTWQGCRHLSHLDKGVYPYLPMATNAPWSILGGMKKFNIKSVDFVHKFNN